MKKILSVILAVMLLLGCVSVTGFAGDECDCGKTPVVMVSGFGATTLVKVNADGSETVAFPFGTDAILDAVKDNLGKFNPDTPFMFIGDIVAQLVDPIRMNPDGTSYYDLKPIFTSAADTSLAAFKENEALEYVPYTGSEFLDMQCLGDELGEDHVFNFLYDWRLSGDDIADSLHDYIKEVIELTGHDKVSIYSLSQGSIYVSQFLYKYAEEGLVDNVVLDNPIMAGSDFVADIFCGEGTEYELNFGEILDLLANILHTEFDLGAIGAMLPAGLNLNNVATIGAQQFILPVVKDGAAYLEMLPDDKFDAVCEMYDFSPELLEKVDKVRSGYMADIEGTLRKAQECGATVSLVTCAGFDLVTGSKVPSDGIVNVATSCGATCSYEGFDADYVQAVDIGKNVISPDRKIDLSTGYLPERTWIINELNHGQVEWSELSLGLVETLLYTHDLDDAWSSYDYPQFMQSDDPSRDLHLRFAETNCLYGIKDGSGTLVLTNISKENAMAIQSITVNGAEILEPVMLPASIKPGEALSFTVDTADITTADVEIEYIEASLLSTEKTKSFTFSVTDDYSGVVESDAEAGSISVDIFNSIGAFIQKLIARLIDYIKNEIIRGIFN